MFNDQKIHILFFGYSEHLIYGSQLDSSFFPGLSRLLIEHNIIILSQLLNIVGPDFKKAVLAQHLGIRSIRLVTQLLMKWQAALEKTEIDLLLCRFPYF